MKPRQQDFTLGLLVIAAIALFVGTVFFVYPRLGGETKNIVFSFPHERGVAPVDTGSKVLLGGALEVGEVERVWPERGDFIDDFGLKRETLLIKISARIKADLALYENCQVTTSQPPVGGGGVVLILSVGDPDHGEVAFSEQGDPPVINGIAAQSLQQVVGNLSRRILGEGGMLDRIETMLDVDRPTSLAGKIDRSLDDINAMTSVLRFQMSPEDRTALMFKLHGIMDQFNLTTTALRAQLNAEDDAAAIAKVHVALDQLGGGLEQAKLILEENRAPVSNALSSVERVAGRLDRELMSAIVAEFDREDPDSILGKVHVGLDSVNTSLSDVVVMTDNMRRLVVLNKPALQRTVDNLKFVSDQLKSAVVEILAAPWKLFRPPADQLKALDILNAARSFADAATMLDDTTARLDAIVQAAPEGALEFESDADIAEIRASLQAAFERFQTAEEYFWKEIQKQ